MSAWFFGCIVLALTAAAIALVMSIRAHREAQRARQAAEIALATARAACAVREATSAALVKAFLAIANK
jgi:hypothetical protein